MKKLAIYSYNNLIRSGKVDRENVCLVIAILEDRTYIGTKAVFLYQNLAKAAKARKVRNHESLNPKP